MKNSTPPTQEEPIFSPDIQFKLFRYLGWAEGASLLILFLIAMPMKYMMGLPLATRIVGSVHGLLFVVYVVMCFQIAFSFNWKKHLLWKALLGSVFPFGTFLFDHKYLSHKTMADLENG